MYYSPYPENGRKYLILWLPSRRGVPDRRPGSLSPVKLRASSTPQRTACRNSSAGREARSGSFLGGRWRGGVPYHEEGSHRERTPFLTQADSGNVQDASGS